MVMLVGEHPGDQEDLTGKPFVRPAGRLLDRALEAAGPSRETMYMTNTVKHFKFEPRGRVRLHKRADAAEHPDADAREQGFSDFVADLRAVARALKD